MRRVDGFFYGLFMDPDVLADSGIVPHAPRQSYVGDYALRIGRRATLVPSKGARAYGMTYALTFDEIDKLYSAPGLAAYVPEAVFAHVDGETVVPALCYNLPAAPDPSEANSEYAERLKSVLTKLGFPDEYVKTVA